ncbi:hypothetical protein CP03DC29_1298B, partial [Chlamydia psittaci 03DC29]
RNSLSERLLVGKAVTR